MSFAVRASRDPAALSPLILKTSHLGSARVVTTRPRLWRHCGDGSTANAAPGSFVFGRSPLGRYNARMKSGLTRERMIEAIRDLPPDASVDDAIERLVFLAKIEEGLAQLDRGEGIPHDEVKRRLGM
jgi:hypothetical protein